MTRKLLTTRRLLAACAAAAMLLTTGLSRAQTSEVVDLPTRPGVTQRVLLLTPAGPVQAAVLLIAGGNGGLQIAADGSIAWGEGHLTVRTRQQFAALGLVAAVVDAPSDRQSPPYLSGFRQTPEHAQDLLAVIAELHKRTGKPVVLVGTSRGTQSAAWVALKSRDADPAQRPDGLVLTATILTDRQTRAVPQMPLEQLTMPVLVSHHEQDGCPLCSFSEIPALTAKIKAPLKVLSYQGGRNIGDPCEARAYHGFNGIESRVVADIAAWIRETVH